MVLFVEFFIVLLKFVVKVSCRDRGVRSVSIAGNDQMPHYTVATLVDVYRRSQAANIVVERLPVLLRLHVNT